MEEEIERLKKKIATMRSLLWEWNCSSGPVWSTGASLKWAKPKRTTSTFSMMILKKWLDFSPIGGTIET